MKAKSSLRFILKIFVLSSLILVLVNCKKKEDENQTQEPQVVIPNTTKVLQNSDFQQYLISIDSSLNTVTFNKDVFSKVKLNVGDVLVSDYGEGYLQKIKSITTTSDKIILQTDSASITDAITTGDILINDSLPPSMVIKTEKLVDGITDKTNYLKSPQEQNYHLTLNFVLFDLDENPATTDDQFRVTGDFIMNPDITIQAKIKNADVQYFKSEFRFTESLSLTATSKILTQLQFDKVIYVFKFPLQVGWIGGVPYTYQPILEIHSGFVLNSNCNAEIGFTQGFTQTVGALYENSDWTTYKTSQKSFEWILPSLSNTISMQAYIKPKLKMTLYGVLSPYLEAKAYGELNANISSTPWWELYIGYDVAIGAQMKIWKKIIFDVKNTVLEDKWKVAEAQSNNQPPANPSYPIPANNASNISTSTSLSWTCTDPDQDPLTYDVYFGTSVSPPLFISDVTNTSITLNSLMNTQKYYWKISAKDNHGHSTQSNIWSFTTAGVGVNIPSVTTTVISAITQTSAISGGGVTSDGGATVTARGVCWSTSSNPTISDPHTSDGTGNGSFTSNIIGLASNTPYYVRAYATNSVGTAYGDNAQFTTTGTTPGEPCPGVPTITYQGQVYNTVQIGNQCWIKENMNYATPNSQCYGNNLTNCENYGRLYTWDDAMVVCPNGWHLPTDAEWCTLAKFADATVNCSVSGNTGTDAGKKLKEEGTTYWQTAGGTDNMGFSALGAGFSSGSSFSALKQTAYFWNQDKVAWHINHNENNIKRYQYSTSLRFSVRCIKD